MLLALLFYQPIFPLHLLLGHPEVLYYEILPHGGVAAHEEVEHLVHAVLLGEVHLVEPNPLAEELLEFIGRNLPKPLESGDFCPLAYLLLRL